MPQENDPQLGEQNYSETFEETPENIELGEN